jgi:hypothetical protein
MYIIDVDNPVGIHSSSTYHTYLHHMMFEKETLDLLDSMTGLIFKKMHLSFEDLPVDAHEGYVRYRREPDLKNPLLPTGRCGSISPQRRRGEEVLRRFFLSRISKRKRPLLSCTVLAVEYGKYRWLDCRRTFWACHVSNDPPTTTSGDDQHPPAVVQQGWLRCPIVLDD